MVGKNTVVPADFPKVRISPCALRGHQRGGMLEKRRH
jgi:hypothetical protein